MNISNFAGNAVYAKLRCMYSKRLTQKNYTELMNLHSVNEIAEYLKAKTSYSEIFEGISHSSEMPRSMLENLLFKKTCDDLTKIMRYQKAAGSSLYEYFIVKYDIEQIISVMGCLAVKSDSYFFSFPVFYNELSKLDLLSLAKVTTTDELLSVTDKSIYAKAVREAVSDYIASGSLATAQSRLHAFIDRYFIKIIAGEKKTKLPKNCPAGDLYKFDCDAYLVKILLRLNRFDLEGKTINKPLLTLFSDAQINSLLSAKSREEIIEITEKTHLKGMLDLTQEDLFTQADRFILKHFEGVFRHSTDPDAVMLSYFFILDNEIKNIIHIIEGVRYSLSPFEIEKLLTVSQNA